MPVTLSHLLSNTAFANALVTNHLPAFFQRQRWYTAKDKTISNIVLTGDPFESKDYGLWLADLSFDDGSNELRVLAVAEVERTIAPDALRLICVTEHGSLIDALGETRFRESMYKLMAEEISITASTGKLVGQAGSVCRNYSAQDEGTSHVPV